MAIVTIRLDTDGEAVWFMEFARKLGHKVEVDFGNGNYCSGGGCHFQKESLPIGEYIVPRFDRQEAAYQLAGYLEDYQSKNPEK